MTHLLRLIQIGDIHRSGGDGSTQSVDWKDNAFPHQLGGAISTSPLQSVMRELVRVCEQDRQSLAGILICGDLTDRGNLRHYLNPAHLEEKYSGNGQNVGCRSKIFAAVV
jgi:hypothetical protein